MPEEKLTTLKELIKIVANSVTRSEFADAFKKVADAVANAKKDLEARIDARLSQVKNGVDGKDGKDGKSIVGPRGPMGPAGRSIFGGRGEPGPAGKDGSPDTPEDIVIKLESLDGEDRLDASAIKNLPEFVQNNYPAVMGGKGPLWALQDVDVSGIVAGQSIRWDGVRWIPYTPAGGGGNTAVYNEEVSGSGTSWTLAHTPASGTLRVYAIGQRLTIVTDYSLSGTTLTTVLSWSAGNILVDYEY
jgi:hypothetical protein